MNAVRRAGGVAGLAALALATMGFGGNAWAETRLVPGSQLVLSSSMSDDVIIGTDPSLPGPSLPGPSLPGPSLAGNVRISMDGALSCLSVVSGRTAVIGTSSCSSDAGQLRIDVSPDTPVTISASSDGNIHVADLRAPLVISVSGDGDVSAGRSGGLVAVVRGSGDVTAGRVDGPATIDIGSSGDVKVAQVHGPLTIKQRGSGDLVVGGIDADAVAVDGSGSGDMLLGKGRIGRLAAHMTGSGDLAVAAAMRDADVDATGGGDVRLAPISGTLSRNASGGSDITIGGAAMVTRLSGEAARRIGHAGSGSGTATTFEAPHYLTHLLTAAFVVLALYIGYRIVVRSGGLGGIRRGFGAAPPAAPTHPGVVALGETMTRLDQRLGRLEGYVTTREFDLNRKFRELGPH